MDWNSREIIGGIIFALGLSLLIYGIFGSQVSFFYSVILLILGIVIFINKKEDEIEQIKRKGGKDK